MAYCTEADVRSATGLTNTTNITSATILGKIGYADAQINAAIAQVYSLPLSATCELIHYLSLEMACVMIEMDNYGEESQNLDKGWGKRLKMVKDALEDIRELKALLIDGSGVELDRNTLRQLAGYPTDASSAPDAVDSTAAKVTMNGLY